MAENYAIEIDSSKPEFRRVFLLLVFADTAIKKIRLQQSRIRKAQMDDTMTSELFADIHFLLITFGNLRKILSEIKKTLVTDVDYENIYSTYSAQLDKLGLVRNHLEHILDGRIDGVDAKGKPLLEPNMLGNLMNDEYNFGGDKFNLADAEVLVTNLEKELKLWNAKKRFYPLW